MKRILFVEDNKVLLELYGMLLDRQRDQWQTTLAPDGETAMKLLKHAAFDVVVSDMKMPGMDGIALLTEVGKLHPKSTRIIISGVSDQAEAANSLNCVHLFLPKPFDATLLRSVLARIGSLDAYLKDDRLRGLAGRMRALPTFPTLYLDIMREIESPNSSVQSIAALIAKDPGITAKILQVANSAALGLAEKVHDSVDAVQHLGLGTVRSLALTAQVYGNYAHRRLKGFSAPQLWGHLMQCGALARAIMRREHAAAADVEDAFTAGLLHDIGKLMLADSLPDEFAEAMAVSEQKRIPLPEAEMEIFGATHAGLAAYLLGLWGLPTAIVEAVAFHQTPEKSSLKQFNALTAVHVANAFSDETGTMPLDMEYLDQIGVTSRLPAWRDDAAELQLEQVI